MNRDSNKRKAYTKKLLQDENALVFQFSIISENSDDLGSKAARAIELVCKENPNKIYAYLDNILKLAENATTDAVIRPLAKILELMAIVHSSSTNSIQLNRMK
ncbi:hypothetical protein ACFSO9_05795 [Mesonia maritima]|uniref:hypothetical protein n=1 Tax=Mesonia maritima TaxID=1793873 RepID=UPI003627D8BB